MLFNTFIYPFFLAITVLFFWCTPKKYRQKTLIVFSLLFYSVTEIKFLILILILALFTYFFGKLIQKKDTKSEKKRILLTGIITIIFVLIFFKYGNLLVQTVGHLLKNSFSITQIFLPLGISFFTFEFIHYLVEIYYNKLPEHTASDFFCFAFFFPTLASGPIKRFPTFFESLKNNDYFSLKFFITGIFLILIGYSQKYLIADNLIERTAFLSTPQLIPSNLSILSGLFIYSLRIFFDFSGLSSIAVGSALLFGIKVPINFYYPYFRDNLASFWKHWHMSLTSWIKDYIYMPIVFRYRNSKYITFFAVILTMALIGLWHGSSWNFLFFGLYHGIGLAILQTKPRMLRLKLIPTWITYGLGVLVTFTFVSLGWPFFVTNSLHDSFLLYGRIFAILM